MRFVRMTSNAHHLRRSRTTAGVALLVFAAAACGGLRPMRAAPAGPAPAPAQASAAAPAADAPAPGAPATVAPLVATEGPSLYHRLGGYDGIAAFTDDFLGRATNDPVIVPFFKGLTPADLQRIRQHLVEQICAATGGPCFYTGKDMKSSHAELEITPAVWNAFTGHLNETVAHFKIGDRERNELVAFVNSVRPDIVNKP
ncbi:MAG TPA: group 1 truncated hemoglobin [Gemmatimonadaceae bacterium]|nr:group 1 truncated hemoglobin [Gemmatimonadaceae bacterium]